MSKNRLLLSTKKIKYLIYETEQNFKKVSENTVIHKTHTSIIIMKSINSSIFSISNNIFISILSYSSQTTFIIYILYLQYLKLKYACVCLRACNN